MFFFFSWNMVNILPEWNNSANGLSTSFFLSCGRKKTCISRHRVYTDTCVHFTAICKMRKHHNWGTTSPKLLYIVVLFRFIERLTISRIWHRSVHLCRGTNVKRSIQYVFETVCCSCFSHDSGNVFWHTTVETATAWQAFRQVTLAHLLVLLLEYCRDVPFHIGLPCICELWLECYYFYMNDVAGTLSSKCAIHHQRQGLCCVQFPV